MTSAVPGQPVGTVQAPRGTSYPIVITVKPGAVVLATTTVRVTAK